MPSPTSSSSISTFGQTASLIINALIAGEKWGGAVGAGAELTYSFPWTNSTNISFFGHDGTIDYSVLNEQTARVHYGLTTTQQTAARSALSTWSAVANIIFSEVPETTTNVGDIRFAWTSSSNPTSDGGKSWGWSYFPDFYMPSGGDVWLSTANKSTDWTVGSYNFLALIHELGHALGLKHPFKNGVTDTSPVLPIAFDSEQYSVMSYTSSSHNLFFKVTTNTDGSRTGNYTTVEPDTPMLYDIVAIQYTYGANLSYKTGNDIYTFDPSTPFFRTLWDAGGTDTISVSNFTKGCVIDLQQGHFSKITIESDSTAGLNWSSPPPTPTYDGTDNLAIAFGCVIENATGGSGNDTLIGNDTSNILCGGAGNDSIDGGSGGLDVALYSGIRSNYALAKTSTGWTLTSTAEGADTLAHIERLQFSNETLALDISGNAGQVYRVYQAAFNRTPDNGGLKYWIGIMDAGKPLDLVTSGFVASAEFQTLYGANPSNQLFVSKLYSNVLHRTPDQGGYDYWTGLLDHNLISKVVALAQFSESPENQAGVIGVIQNGIDLLN